jgi:hypothetical protein
MIRGLLTDDRQLLVVLRACGLLRAVNSASKRCTYPKGTCSCLRQKAKNHAMLSCAAGNTSNQYRDSDAKILLSLTCLILQVNLGKGDACALLSWVCITYCRHTYPGRASSGLVQHYLEITTRFATRSLCARLICTNAQLIALPAHLSCTRLLQHCNADAKAITAPKQQGMQ